MNSRDNAPAMNSRDGAPAMNSPDDAPAQERRGKTPSIQLNKSVEAKQESGPCSVIEYIRPNAHLG
jgi:hypothetical protein